MEQENDRDEVVQNLVEEQANDSPLDLIHTITEQRVSELKCMIGEQDDETEIEMSELENSETEVIL